MEANPCRNECTGLLNPVRMARVHKRPRTAGRRVVSRLFFVVSLAPFMRDLTMSGSTPCFVQPPLLQTPVHICSWWLCWAHMFLQPWHAMSFNSSPFAHEWLCNGSPGGSHLIPKASLHCSCVQCGLFRGDRKERLSILFYIRNRSKNGFRPPYSDSIISCFIRMRSQNYRLIIPHRAPAWLLLYLIYPFWCYACWNTSSYNLIV